MAAADDIKQLTEQGLLYHKLHGEGDFEGLAEKIYSHDCVLMPPEGPTIHGPELIKLFAANGPKAFVTENIDLLVEGSMAVTCDKYTGYHVNGTMASRGNVLTVWLKRDGQWKMKFDMWTKDA